MKRSTILLLTALIPALAACGSKEAVEGALAALPNSNNNPSQAPAPTAEGKNNGKAFQALSAGISRDPNIPGMYQVVVYGEKQDSACYGLGNTSVKIPVSQTGTIGRHSLRPDDLTASATFADGEQQSREGTGYIEITEFTDKGGSAKLSIGEHGSNNFLEGEITFENCVK